MLLPYVSSRDRWLSEGLASYYQNVLRARDGRLSEQEAWQRMHAGFERGRRATRKETLSEATRSGWRSTMRVYWSGAAMMLKADSRLRALSDGEQSLDSALEMLSKCCMARGRSWRARDLFAELDRLTGYTIFSDLYDDHVLDNEFPDVQSTFTKLGIVPRYGSITIDDGAPWKTIRRAIMSG
jgi:predicted metalloprotease with PDZ domain